MDRFKSILVTASPGHLEPLTLRAAVELADVNDARLTVLDIVAPLPGWRRTMSVEGRVIDIEAALLRDRGERLRRMVENTRGRPDTEVIVTVGEPFIEVIRRVLAGRHDLVMAGEPAVVNPDEPQLSSGVMHVLRKCPVPVWVMRPSRNGSCRILALVDPDPDDPVRDGLNDLVLELATSLAHRKDGELHIGHAWTLEGEATLRSSPYVGLPGALVDVMVREIEATRLEQLDALAIRHARERDRSIHMVAGEPGVVLPRLADRLKIDLIVMGTVGRTGLRGLVMGNTAETILRSVRCSVLAVKPEGFTTPVKPRRRSYLSSKESS
ncbi:MAG: universal stress protein [Actinomycetota bacterium]|nr:universal stress protein [Actinomycetota bacterium]